MTTSLQPVFTVCGASASTQGNVDCIFPLFHSKALKSIPHGVGCRCLVFLMYTIIRNVLPSILHSQAILREPCCDLQSQSFEGIEVLCHVPAQAPFS